MQHLNSNDDFDDDIDGEDKQQWVTCDACCRDFNGSMGVGWCPYCGYELVDHDEPDYDEEDEWDEEYLNATSQPRDFLANTPPVDAVVGDPDSPGRPLVCPECGNVLRNTGSYSSCLGWIDKTCTSGLFPKLTPEEDKRNAAVQKELDKAE